MLYNYIKFSIRHLAFNKAFSAINILGLAISLAAFILMALYIEDELSIDTFHAKASQIYRIADDKQTPDILLRGATSAAPVAPALLRELPEIKEAARLIDAEGLVKYGDKLFEERKLYYADASIFNIFSYPLLKGDARNALVQPQSIVLTARMATKYFGNTEPLGKQLSLDGKPMQVTGVMQNLPANTHLQFDALLSMATAAQKGSGYDWLFTNWYSNNFYTYVLLDKNASVTSLQAKLTAFEQRHQEKGVVHHYVPEKLTDIYLHSSRDNQAGKTGNITNLYVFTLVAIFILLIACINFINLSTATASSRSKEIAVKKVAGAAKQQMIMQFFAESFIMVGIAFVITLALVVALLPLFNSFSGKTLQLDLFSPIHTVCLILLFTVIGLFSGSYPALVLSRFKPANALKGKINASGRAIVLRKGLVVFQFAISVILIICTVIIYQQMNFLQKQDLGFRPGQTMVINFEGDRNVQKKLGFLKQNLLQIPGVTNVTASSNVPGDNAAGSWSMDFAMQHGDTIHTELPVYVVDHHFLQQFNIAVIAGREFSENYAADTTESMVINETALLKLGIASPKDAIGLTAGMYPSDGKITGVVKDFHYESLQKAVAPLVMRVIPFKFRLLSVKMSTADIGHTVSTIEQTWKRLCPERPLEYSFLDESFNRQYESVIKFSALFSIFSGLAIFVACLGLLGLALFSVQQRKKEIGIRKVLGAGLLSIAATINKEFLLLVLAAIIIATPVAWWAMYAWLQNFAYRTWIHWWVFVASGMVTIFIALLTVSFHAIRAALDNPVKTLKSE